MFHRVRRGEIRVESRASRFFFALILFVLPAIGLSQAITEYAVPTAAPTDLYGITKGPDGAVWFGESRTAKIGRVAPDGTITSSRRAGSLAISSSRPTAASGSGRRSIGRMTLSGQSRFSRARRTDRVRHPQDTRPVPGRLWLPTVSVGSEATAVVTVLPCRPARVGAYPYAIGPARWQLWFTDGDNQGNRTHDADGVLTVFRDGFAPRHHRARWGDVVHDATAARLRCRADDVASSAFR
jgi:hypothetical protein